LACGVVNGFVVGLLTGGLGVFFRAGAGLRDRNVEDGGLAVTYWAEEPRTNGFAGDNGKRWTTLFIVEASFSILLLLLLTAGEDGRAGAGENDRRVALVVIFLGLSLLRNGFSGDGGLSR